MEMKSERSAYMVARIVQRRGGMQNGFLGEVEHLRNVERHLRRTFHTRLHFLSASPLVSN